MGAGAGVAKTQIRPSQAPGAGPVPTYLSQTQSDPAVPAPVPLTKWNHKRQQEEGKVASLMELGFGRADACGALESAKGDVDVAAAMLFSNMQ